MGLAKVVFLAAAAWGLLVLTPFYFRYEAMGRETPPPITHPEFYFGFAGVALAWQLAFLLIGLDPVRFRPLMPVAVIEKFSFVIAMAVLFLQGRVAPGGMLYGAVADLILGTLFIAAFMTTRSRAAATARVIQG